MLPFGAVAKKFSDTNREEVWRNDPAKWAEDHGLFMWSKQREVAKSVVRHQKTLVVTGNGVGKAFRLTEKLLTPTGWTTMGAVVVGDWVYDEEGLPTRVTGKSPVWELPLYRVVFDDGAVVECPGAHEWATLTSAQKRAHESAGGDVWDFSNVHETSALFRAVEEGIEHWVPCCGPIGFERDEVEAFVEEKGRTTAAGVSHVEFLDADEAIQFEHLACKAGLKPKAAFVEGWWHVAFELNPRQQPMRRITRIERAGTGEVQCIEVDSPRHLYLVGEHMIPTHNSRLSATLVNWWVDTHPVDDTTVVTTATNWKQVRNVLWKEIPRVKAAAGVEGRINSNAEWKGEGRKDPVAFGMKPDDKDESGFQGVHDQYVLVVLDEAGGISKEIFTAADAITTNKHARILAIANPNDPSCYMAEVYKQQLRLPEEERLWNIIQFGAYESPNFTGEVVPLEVATRLVQKEWVEARKREWGEDDPRFVARVLGQFPDVSDDGLFNMGRVMQSMEQYKDHDPDVGAPVTIGVDVARYGSDSSVVVSNQGGHIRVLARFQGKNGPELAREVGMIATEAGAVEVRIDAIGVGASVLDNIENYLPPNIQVIGIHGNAKSADSTKWYNWRAAMYDQFAKDVAFGRVWLPDDDELYSEIASIKYEYRGSALLIESKENMRKRGVKSPDTLDAVVYAYQDINALSNGIGTGDGLITLDDLLDDDDDDWYDDWSVFLA
nr:MAG TPA: large terminase [Caudoviricetes sp.]